MNEELFKKLISKEESETIIFKEISIPLRSKPNNAKLIKELLSMANTIRTTSAYIIEGVKVNSNLTKDLLGIASLTDDADLQSVCQDKTIPRIKFSYEIFPYEGKKYGIFQIPVVNYNRPCTSGKDLSNIVLPNKVYIRGTHGSIEIANPDEVQKIYEWLDELKRNTENITSSTHITNITQKGDRNINIKGNIKDLKL